MMKNIYLALIAIGIFAACKNPENGKSDATKATAEQIIPDDVKMSRTYMYHDNINDNHIVLHLVLDGSNAKGHLTYELKEKDKNDGSFEGTFHKGLLIADYTFASEGTTSVRQVAFKVNYDTAIEGYGDMEERDGKMVFLNSGRLNYDTTMILVHTVD